MFLGDPYLQLRLYGETYDNLFDSEDEDGSYTYDEEGNLYVYDSFIGKWLKKEEGETLAETEGHCTQGTEG